MNLDGTEQQLLVSLPGGAARHDDSEVVERDVTIEIHTENHGIAGGVMVSASGTTARLEPASPVDKAGAQSRGEVYRARCRALASR